MELEFCFFVALVFGNNRLILTVTIKRKNVFVQIFFTKTNNLSNSNGQVIINLFWDGVPSHAEKY